MKNIIIVLVELCLTSCTSTKSTFSAIGDKIKGLSKAKCYVKETKSIKIGCK